MQNEPRLSTRQLIVYLPIITWNRTCYKSRLRWVGGFKFHKVIDLYPDTPELSVRRYWVGPFLLTVMIKHG